MSPVANFVHRHNGVPQYDGTNDTQTSRRKSTKNDDLEDLKVPVPKLSSGHSHGGGRHGPSTRSRSQAGHVSVPGNGQFGTNASDADRTSGAGTEQFLSQGKLMLHRASYLSRFKRENNLSESVDADAGAEGAETRTPYDQQNTPTLQDLKQRRLSGDSYPATTSGRPSEVDSVDAHHTQQPTRPHVQNMQAHPHSLPMAGQTRSLVATNDMTAPSPVQAHSSKQAQIPAQVRPNITMPGFTFPPGPSRTPASQSTQHTQHARPTQHDPRAQVQAQSQAKQHQQHQQHQHALQVQPAAQRPRHDQSAGTQLHTTTTPYGPAVDMGIYGDSFDGPNARREPDVPVKIVTNRNRTPEVQQPSPPPVNEHLNHNNLTDGSDQQHPRQDMPAGSDDPHSESHFQNGIDDDSLQDIAEGQPAQLSQAQPPSREPSPELDIMPPELFQKDYADIKAQPFDVDPHSKAFDFPQDKPTDTLQGKIEAVMLLESQAQVTFLTNLTTEQWEDAGDWFIERFGDLVRKLKDTRREKRKAARAFEDEVEQRHEAITKKQKLTVSALSEMKENGGKVLQGTPKKSHKTRSET